MYTKFRIQALFLFLVFLSTKAQEGINQEETLVEHLTAINLEIETKFINAYCDCENKSQFVTNYQNVAKEFNKIINKHITQLATLKTRDAINHFNTINKGYPDNKEWLNAENALKTFKDTSCPPTTRGFLPAAVTIAEITGIANSIIGLINEGKKRRDAQRDKLIALLEANKIPSIQVYMLAFKCKEKKEVEEQE